MVHALIYGMRGWIAFVAFIEFSNAIRCFTEDNQFLNKIYDQPNALPPVAVRMFGRYFLLNGIIMTHCALFIHHLPIISLSICSLLLVILLHLSESLYYFTSPFNFYIMFPTFISVSTIICLMVAPMFLEEPKNSSASKFRYSDDDDEDDESDNGCARNVKQERHNSTVKRMTGMKLKTN